MATAIVVLVSQSWVGAEEKSPTKTPETSEKMGKEEEEIMHAFEEEEEEKEGEGLRGRGEKSGK